MDNEQISEAVVPGQPGVNWKGLAIDLDCLHEPSGEEAFIIGVEDNFADIWNAIPTDHKSVHLASLKVVQSVL